MTVGEFVAQHLCEPKEEKVKPKSSMAAKWSLPFALGVALTQKGVQIDNFRLDRLSDPQVLKMAGRVNYKVDTGFGVFIPAVVDIRINGGRIFSKRVETLYGHPQNPIRDSDLIEKFKDCVQHGRNPLPQNRIEQVIKAALNLEAEKI